ncbi:zinc-dependent metalloprotease [Bifidobacterium tsurumiense]|uniref:zinc-dependent metalloprotease n=1 Tax=Bifidobacterium tsurumiense TaxID=356829 RepID=UPI0012B276EA|nr:zinc-dependent metalloprotease [Bifidobacterium tsurumiense]MDY4677625.1 zinc-dependent metalloprotease [Bifidobacterium tsurumiense]MSS13023.1 zinc-dependent metalloprotease [Bifidobacterium tsurumiense]
MDENAIHQWLIDCFGPIQGEMAWNQLSQLPPEVRDQLMSQGVDKLPKPEEVQALMQAFASGGLNTPSEMQQTVEQGPINVKLATSIALQKANEGGQSTVNAEDGESARKAISEANLWLDTACEFNPAPGEMQVLTRAGWVEQTLDAWAQFAAPVAQSMNNALSSVMSERFGDSFDGEVAGMFAGPVPIPLPEGMNNPAQLMKLLGNTSFAMQLGHAAGDLSQEVRGSYDQGIALLKNPAGALIVQNALEYAKSLGIDEHEVLAFLALQEAAHARLFASVPWLMPRFEALIGKYARGIDIDLDAMESQLRDAGAMDPESISDAVNLTKVAIPDTPEQKEALASLENLLAIVEGWVDSVTWRAGMAHIPHIEQLREMLRRERAVGGPAQRTFESLLGLNLRPKRIREAAALWDRIGAEEGDAARDGKWAHPDMLPGLPSEATQTPATTEAETTDNGTQNAISSDANLSANAKTPDSIDWDAELSKLLEDNQSADSEENSDQGQTNPENREQDGNLDETGSDEDADHDTDSRDEGETGDNGAETQEQ